jgi:hypothetical protein
MRKNILYGLGILLTIGLLWLYYSTLLGAIKSSVEERQKHEKELNDKTLENIFASQKIDSLNKANDELSKYKALTKAMIHRDEAANQLKHKVGDMVYLKSDSARVVIEDVLIGGGKYNYYVKYRVLLKDNTTREMVPELIY